MISDIPAGDGKRANLFYSVADSIRHDEIAMGSRPSRVSWLNSGVKRWPLDMLDNVGLMCL